MRHIKCRDVYILWIYPVFGSMKRANGRKSAGRMSGKISLFKISSNVFTVFLIFGYVISFVSYLMLFPK